MMLGVDRYDNSGPFGDLGIVKATVSSDALKVISHSRHHGETRWVSTENTQLSSAGIVRKCSARQLLQAQLLKL